MYAYMQEKETELIREKVAENALTVIFTSQHIHSLIFFYFITIFLNDEHSEME